MDTGDLLAVIRARHGTEYQADDPILVAKTIVEYCMAEEREKTRVDARRDRDRQNGRRREGDAGPRRGLICHQTRGQSIPSDRKRG